MTLSDLKRRFPVGLIARFTDGSGYCSLQDMARDYPLKELYEMLKQAEDEDRIACITNGEAL